METNVFIGCDRGKSSGGLVEANNGGRGRGNPLGRGHQRKDATDLQSAVVAVEP